MANNKSIQILRGNGHDQDTVLLNGQLYYDQTYNLLFCGQGGYNIKTLKPVNNLYIHSFYTQLKKNNDTYDMYFSMINHYSQPIKSWDELWAYCASTINPCLTNIVAGSVTPSYMGLFFDVYGQIRDSTQMQGTLLQYSIINGLSLGFIGGGSDTVVLDNFTIWSIQMAPSKFDTNAAYGLNAILPDAWTKNSLTPYALYDTVVDLSTRGR